MRILILILSWESCPVSCLVLSSSCPVLRILSCPHPILSSHFRPSGRFRRIGPGSAVSATFTPRPSASVSFSPGSRLGLRPSLLWASRLILSYLNLSRSVTSHLAYYIRFANNKTIGEKWNAWIIERKNQQMTRKHFKKLGSIF